MSILSLVRLGNVYASGRHSCGQASMYRPCHTYYVTILVFVCLYVHTTLADGTPCAGRPVGNSPEFIPLDNLLNRDILHSLRMHSVFEPLHCR